MRTLHLIVLLSVVLPICGCDPVGERRLRVDLPLTAPTTRFPTTGERVTLASDIADKMARRYGWTADKINSDQVQRGVFRRYIVPVDDYTMHAELSLSPANDFIELHFTNWTSLKESRKAQRWMREFDREFTAAFNPAQGDR